MKAIIEFEVDDEEDFKKLKTANKLPNEIWYLKISEKELNQK